MPSHGHGMTGPDQPSRRLWPGQARNTGPGKTSRGRRHGRAGPRPLAPSAACSLLAAPCPARGPGPASQAHRHEAHPAPRVSGADAAGCRLRDSSARKWASVNGPRGEAEELEDAACGQSGGLGFRPPAPENGARPSRRRPGGRGGPHPSSLPPERGPPGPGRVLLPELPGSPLSLETRGGRGPSPSRWQGGGWGEQASHGAMEQNGRRVSCCVAQHGSESVWGGVGPVSGLWRRNPGKCRAPPPPARQAAGQRVNDRAESPPDVASQAPASLFSPHSPLQEGLRTPLRPRGTRSTPPIRLNPLRLRGGP